MTINKNTIKRLARDIKEVYKYSTTNNNIYYKHDDDNILIGYALIFGTKDTPYQYGNFLFKITFPEDYPYLPPKFTFLSNDNIYRYHPNLYKNGTCCLSILNTWQGDQWTSCQTILSILLTLSSIFQQNPLLLEPGIKINHPDLIKYNQIITYKNFDFIIKDIVEIILYNKKLNITNDLKFCISLFSNEILNNFKNNKLNILNELSKYKNTPIFDISSSIYGLHLTINYNILTDKINKIEI